jgi:lysozyme family protein
MTADEIIDQILEREGGFTNDPDDAGGATNWGITAATLGDWRRLGRVATVDEVKALPKAEARLIYQKRYIEAPGFTAENVWNEPLRIALIDEGVNAGPSVAVKHLQEALDVTVDGEFGPETKRALEQHLKPAQLLRLIVRLRCIHYGRIVQRNPSQRKYLVGWLARAFDMLEN